MEKNRFSRNKYYDGKELTADLFEGIDSYHGGRLKILLRVLFGRAVMCGCNISELYPDVIQVSGGAAVDGSGNLIYIPKNEPIPLKGLLKNGLPQNRVLNVWLSFNEQEDDDVTAEKYAFSSDEPTGGVLLAAVRLNENGTIAAIENRRLAFDSFYLRDIRRAISADIEDKLAQTQKEFEENKRQLINSIEAEAENLRDVPAVRSGTFTINARTRSKKFLSEEIKLDLIGNPQISVGFVGEYSGSTEVIYGDTGLFKRKGRLEIQSQAIRVIKPNNSFVFCVQFTKAVKGKSFQFEWSAIGETESE
ncbi:MAG: hypothetical protein LBN40_00840 [Oscillospiraceae bacterium]|jgi:hypothetical protein|nr:hypothetical protein [Oscillospiraceae bacterium]